MRFWTTALVLFLSCWISNVFADDSHEAEVAFRESPHALYEKIAAEIPTNLQLNSREELTAQAKALQLSPEQMIFNMVLLARLNLNIQIHKSSKQSDAKHLIDMLQKVVQGDDENAALLNLEGRFQGVVNQDYNATIQSNNDALSLIADDNDQRAMLLKYVIYEDLGIVNLMTKKSQAALNNLTQLKDIAYRLRDDYLIAEAETKLGKYFRDQGQLNRALEHYTEAYRIAAKINKPYQKAILQFNLAKLYRDLQQWDDALNYIYQAIDSFKALKLDIYLSNSMTVIATIYANQGKWNKAIDYYLNAQQIDARLQNFTAQGLNFHNLGEAYFKLGNTQNALDYLYQANKIFRDRKSDHYLIYNELLIAQVASASNTWDLVLEHARNAEVLAQKLKLNSELAEALEYQVNALKAKGEEQAVIGLQDKIISLKQTLLEQQKSRQENNNVSELNEQQLLLKLTEMQQQMRQQREMLNTRDYFIITVLILLIISGSYCLYLLRRRYHSQRQLQELLALSVLEPVTALPGYRGFCQQLQQGNCHAIALLGIASDFDHDLRYGHHQTCNKQHSLLHKLRHLAQANVYSIRPGLFALTFAEATSAKEIMQRLQELSWNEQPLNYDLGFLGLPLLADTDIQLPPVILFETLQLALAGSLSLPRHQNHYVSLSALDFTPSGIFSNPLYLQLQKSIERGFIRVETNGNKSDIQWPEPLMSATSDYRDVI